MTARQQRLKLTPAAPTSPPPSPAAGSPTQPPEPFRIVTTLTRSPELTSCGELQEALRCVGQLDGRRQTVEATRDLELARIRERAAQELHVVIDGERLTFDEWRGNLITAIERFTRDNKPAVFEDGKQTAKFPAGQVSYKRVEPAVRLAPEVKGQDIADRLASRKKLVAAIQALLNRLKLAGFLRVKVELDLQGIQADYRDGKLKAKQLPAGLIVTEEREDISVKPLPQPDRADVAA